MKIGPRFSYIDLLNFMFKVQNLLLVIEAAIFIIHLNKYKKYACNLKCCFHIKFQASVLKIYSKSYIFYNITKTKKS